MHHGRGRAVVGHGDGDGTDPGGPDDRERATVEGRPGGGVEPFGGLGVGAAHPGEHAGAGDLDGDGTVGAGDDRPWASRSSMEMNARSPSSARRSARSAAATTARSPDAEVREVRPTSVPSR